MSQKAPGSEYNPLTISSSEEDDQPLHTIPHRTRTKPNKKKKKHRAQFIGSLVASLVIFLMVMVAILSLATSHSVNSSKTTVTSKRLTTLINNIISDNNYEELADPKNIIIDVRETNNTKENVQKPIGGDNSTNVLLDSKDTTGNETVHKDSIEHGLLDMEDKPNNGTAFNKLVISKVISSANTNNTADDATRDISAAPFAANDVDENVEVDNVIDPGEYIVA